MYRIAGNFGGNKIWLTWCFRQNKIHHFEPLYARSMARGHKFVKLKFTNHQNFEICQILVPPKLPAIWYAI